MPFLSDIQSLREYDSDVRYPMNAWTHAEVTEHEKHIADLLEQVARLSGVSLNPEGSEEFQDGPVFMCAQEYGEVSGVKKSDVLSGLYFSQFSRLVTGERFSERSRISTEAWSNIVSVISKKHSFWFVEPKILKSKYDGVLECSENATWWWRFFGAWY